MRISWISTLILLGACSAPVPPGAAGGRADAALRDAASDTELDALGAYDAPLREDAPLVADAPVTADASASDAAQGAYPAGPYGSAVGSVVADLRWEGFFNESNEDVSTELPFGPTSLGAVRATGAPFALVHLSGFL